MGTLTERQRTVLQCAANGNSNKDIAALLGISQQIVKHHFCEAYMRLGVARCHGVRSCKVRAVVEAYKLGLVH